MIESNFSIMMPPLVFDNSTMTITGYLNGTQPIELIVKGMAFSYVQLNGMDVLTLGVISLVVLQVITVVLLIWQHYHITFGGSRRW